MPIDKISFRATTPQVQNSNEKPAEVATEEQPVDEEKSNATKYMVGATALAGVVALGVAGYKGHLGKGIQKFLGGVEKSADASISKFAKFSEEELEKVNAKQMKELTETEFKRYVNTVIPEDEPVARKLLHEFYSETKESSDNVGESFAKLSEGLKDVKKRLGEDFYKKLVGKDSILDKKLADIKVADVTGLIDHLPQEFLEQIPAEKLDINKVKGMLGMLDGNKKLSEVLKGFEEEIPKEVDMNKSLIDTLINFAKSQKS